MAIKNIICKYYCSAPNVTGDIKYPKSDRDKSDIQAPCGNCGHVNIINPSPTAFLVVASATDIFIADSTDLNGKKVLLQTGENRIGRQGEEADTWANIKLRTTDARLSRSHFCIQVSANSKKYGAQHNSYVIYSGPKGLPVRLLYQGRERELKPDEELYLLDEYIIIAGNSKFTFRNPEVFNVQRGGDYTGDSTSK